MDELVKGALKRAGTVLRGLLSLGRVERSSSAAAEHVEVQTSGLYDDDTQHWQPYGLQARPKAGAIALQAAVGGRSETVATILVHDARYTLELEDGEVTLVDDLGQKVHLTRTGIVVDAPSIKLGAGASAGAARIGDAVTLDSGLVVWLQGLATAAGYLTPIPTPAGGTITSGSSQTQIE